MASDAFWFNLNYLRLPVLRSRERKTRHRAQLTLAPLSQTHVSSYNSARHHSNVQDSSSLKDRRNREGGSPLVRHPARSIDDSINKDSVTAQASPAAAVLATSFTSRRCAWRGRGGGAACTDRQAVRSPVAAAAAAAAAGETQGDPPTALAGEKHRLAAPW